MTVFAVYPHDAGIFSAERRVLQSDPAAREALLAEAMEQMPAGGHYLSRIYVETASDQYGPYHRATSTSDIWADGQWLTDKEHKP